MQVFYSIRCQHLVMRGSVSMTNDHALCTGKAQSVLIGYQGKHGRLDLVVCPST